MTRATVHVFLCGDKNDKGFYDIFGGEDINSRWEIGWTHWQSSKVTNCFGQSTLSAIFPILEEAFHMKKYPGCSKGDGNWYFFCYLKRSNTAVLVMQFIARMFRLKLVIHKGKERIGEIGFFDEGFTRHIFSKRAEKKSAVAA